MNYDCRLVRILHVSVTDFFDKIAVMLKIATKAFLFKNTPQIRGVLSAAMLLWYGGFVLSDWKPSGNGRLGAVRVGRCCFDCKLSRNTTELVGQPSKIDD